MCPLVLELMLVPVCDCVGLLLAALQQGCRTLHVGTVGPGLLHISPPSLLTLHVHTHALSPTQVLTETFKWVSTAVTAFLLPAFKVPSLIDWAKEGMGNASAATRTAAVQLLGTMHAFLGPGLAELVRGGLLHGCWAGDCLCGWLQQSWE